MENDKVILARKMQWIKIDGNNNNNLTKIQKERKYNVVVTKIIVVVTKRSTSQGISTAPVVVEHT